MEPQTEFQAVGSCLGGAAGPPGAATCGLTLRQHQLDVGPLTRRTLSPALHGLRTVGDWRLMMARQGLELWDSAPGWPPGLRSPVSCMDTICWLSRTHLTPQQGAGEPARGAQEPARGALEPGARAHLQPRRCRVPSVLGGFLVLEEALEGFHGMFSGSVLPASPPSRQQSQGPEQRRMSAGSTAGPCWTHRDKPGPFPAFRGE